MAEMVLGGFGVGFGFGEFVGDKGVDFVKSEGLVIFDVF
jgi:hypothetical protein